MAKSHAVDVHVGARMRQRRALLGMNQTAVGNAVGVTFQQIQKYERGSNRIGSSRLFEFAKVLEVPVSYFFDEMPSNALAGRPMSGRGRKGFGRGGNTFRTGEGSADQARDPGARAGLLQDSRGPGAQAILRDGQGRGRRQPC
jgi:DNA-binding XRE family transcriptional regulator